MNEEHNEEYRRYALNSLTKAELHLQNALDALSVIGLPSSDVVFLNEMITQLIMYQHEIEKTAG
jgi:hypothetical protein